MNIWKKIGFLTTFTLPISLVLAHYYGIGVLLFFPFIYAYVLSPFIDLIMGRDSRNVMKDEVDSLTEEKYFDVLVYAHVWIQIGLLVWSVFVLPTEPVNWLKIFALISGQGVYSASIINVAHELGHRNSAIAQFHARLALVSVAYSHFTVEHNRGHHVHVATPLDPATSKKNQTLYEFWIQTLIGSFKSAWKLEKTRLSKINIKEWSVSNKVISGHLLTVLFFAFLICLGFLISGKIFWAILLFLVVQSAIAILSLEAVNYIEHYGIMRKINEAGRYERVNPLHSWNSNHLYSNFMLFQLQRHSDHHANASKPYQVLNHVEDSPQLPFGYPLMIIMSMIPTIFFRKVNPILESWESKVGIG
jgi:alkane 1-monooxygenase